MFVFVDTSAWVALANSKDPNGKRVAAELKASGVRAMTSTYVFDETVTLLQRRLDHASASAMGDYLRSQEVELMPIDEEDAEAAWSLFKDRPDKGYSFTDCTSFVLMRRLGVKDAITLDDDFRKERFKVKP